MATVEANGRRRRRQRGQRQEKFVHERNNRAASASFSKIDLWVCWGGKINFQFITQFVTNIMAFGVDEHTFCVAVRVRRGMMCSKVTLCRLGNDGKVTAAARSEVLSYPWPINLPGLRHFVVREELVLIYRWGDINYVYYRINHLRLVPGKEIIRKWNTMYLVL